jgi:hypothetical protein
MIQWKNEELGEFLSQWHLNHHRFNMDWTGIEPRYTVKGWQTTAWVTA